MNIGDKVENVHTGETGVLLGDGLCDSSFYVRTDKELIWVESTQLYLNWVVVERCDTSKPIRSLCMFS